MRASAKELIASPCLGGEVQGGNVFVVWLQMNVGGLDRVGWLDFIVFLIESRSWRTCHFFLKHQVCFLADFFPVFSFLK